MKKLVFILLLLCCQPLAAQTTAKFFGFDQLLFGGSHETTGLTYGWQRSWNSTCVWALIEASAGTYNFATQCASFVQSAANHHAGVTLVMGRTPASRITGSCSGGAFGIGCPQLASDIDSANTITGAFITAFASYMSANWPSVAWRVEGRNEADLANECAENSTIGGHCSMVHLVKEQHAIYTAAKAVSSSIEVLCPSSSTFNRFGVHLYGGTDSVSAPFTGSGFAAAGGLAYCDTMNVHPYFYSSGSSYALTPEEAVNGSFTCSATSTTMSGGLGQIACLLAANSLSSMPVRSTETDWGSNPSNFTMTDPQKIAWIGRYIVYAWNAKQVGVDWYTWECGGGVLSACFGTLYGSGVTNAAALALGNMQDWLIGSTQSTSCTVTSNAYNCPLTVNTASGKTGAATIVFTNDGTTPTISTTATTAYRLDGTKQTLSGTYTLDGEPTLLVSQAAAAGPAPPTNLVLVSVQ